MQILMWIQNNTEKILHGMLTLINLFLQNLDAHYIPLLPK